MPSLRPVPADDAEAIFFASALHNEMVVRYEDPDPCGGPGPLDPRARWLLVIADSGEAVGVGAVQPLSHTVDAAAPDEGEIKRVYITPSARGQGLSKMLMAELEVIAVREGWPRLRLETGVRQPEAVALYQSSGWIPVPAYGHYKSSPESRCFAKVVGDYRSSPVRTSTFS